MLPASLDFRRGQPAFRTDDNDPVRTGLLRQNPAQALRPGAFIENQQPRLRRDPPKQLLPSQKGAYDRYDAPSRLPRRFLRNLLPAA